MQCTQFRDHVLDLATGATVSGEVREHVRTCQACAAEVVSLQKTMALLDEWQAPQDSSPYFMTRLRARIREEAQRTPTGWLSWFRKPALALSTAILLLASISLINGVHPGPTGDNRRNTDMTPRISSPVNDLQYLDDNKDLLANFELLDDEAQQEGTPQ